MRLRNVRVLILGLTLAAAAAQASSSASAEGSAASATGVTDHQVGQLSGNSFGSALASPFKALGRIFGGGKKEKKKEEQRQAGIDPKKFESSVGVRVSDARTQAQPEAVAAAAADTTAADRAPGAEAISEAAHLLARGREQLAAARVNDAIASLSRASSLDASAETYNLLGVAYAMKSMPQAARDAYEQALRLAPHDAETLNNYGFFLYRRGEFKEAKDYLKRAAKYAPADEKVWNNLALAQCRLGKFDDAFKSFVRAGGDFKGRMNVANQLELAGRDKDALKYYEQARQFNPTARDLMQHLADVYQRLGMEHEAAVARAALKRDAKDAHAEGMQP